MSDTTIVSPLSPGCNRPTARQRRAAALAASGAVTLRADDTATVRSQTDPSARYTVDPNNRFACNCFDQAAARRGECKHALAVRVVYRALRLARAIAGDELELRGRRAAAERIADDPTRDEFERHSAEILARAYRMVWDERYGQPAAEDASWSTRPAVPAETLERAKALFSTRQERETARPAPHHRRTPGRWKV